MRPLFVVLVLFFNISLTVRARIDNSKKPGIKYHHSKENFAPISQVIDVPTLPCPEGQSEGHSGECRPIFQSETTTIRPPAVIYTEPCPEGYRVGHTGDCRPIFGYTTKGN